MSIEEKTRLTPEQLRQRFSDDWVPWAGTGDIPVCQEIVGQERALRAIRLGLQLKSIGYNIFITGLSGTGKMTTIKSLLEEIDRSGKIPDDLCYVNNFKNPDMPVILYLPAGKGFILKKELEGLISQVRSILPELLESDEFKNQWEQLVEDAQQREKELIRKFEAKVAEQKFSLVQIQYGNVQRPELLPVVEDKSLNINQLAAMVTEKKFSQAEFDKIEAKHKELLSEMIDISKFLKKLQKEIRTSHIQLRKNIVEPVLDEFISDIKTQLPYDNVAVYLDEVREDILERLDIFQEKQEQPQQDLVMNMIKPDETVDPFLSYAVNVIVDNSELKRAPVIIETTPTYRNVFGTIEKNIDRRGAVKTDFTRIKAGSFLRANGGYLVVNARDALLEPEVWKNFKRALKYNEISIQSWDPFYLYGSVFLKPEPIEINVKVVIIGDKEIYHVLYALDEDFKKMFKVQADFDSVMRNSSENVACFASLMRKICEEDNLIHFNNDGIKAVLEYAVRFAGRKNKLTTRFSDVADLMREASFWAVKDGLPTVDRAHVEKAYREKMFRSNLPEEKIQELIDENVILIDTKDSVVGQINGLSVYLLGNYSFGKPTRITAQASVGGDGIINIEREAGMSGRTHDKGVLILNYFLRSRYTKDKPLSMNASLCFEQSYSGVDGDSASSTEIYALMSALSEVPIRQDLAVTGSVNQKGKIQAIGGVNEKIEGFFDVCASRGLTGTQGVVIPVQNVDDLMLREELINAVRDGKFHIYAISDIDEGIELLMGIPVGEKDKMGKWPENSINQRVDTRLQDFADTMKAFRTD